MIDALVIFKGFEKVGIDTSILVNLIIKETNLFKFKEKEFSIKNIFFYARKTKYEFIGVMINRYGFDKKEARKLWKKTVNAFNLNLIRIGNKDMSSYISQVKEVNNLLVKNRDNPNFQMTYKIGDSDIEIISHFLKEKVDLVYTSDRAFYETCKALGLKSKIICLSECSKMERNS